VPSALAPAESNLFIHFSMIRVPPAEAFGTIRSSSNSGVI
jgi:hypothetical protein